MTDRAALREYLALQTAIFLLTERTPQWMLNRRGSKSVAAQRTWSTPGQTSKRSGKS